MINDNFLEKEIYKQGDFNIKMDAALDYANKAQQEVGGVINPRNKPVIMVFADRPRESHEAMVSSKIL